MIVFSPRTRGSASVHALIKGEISQMPKRIHPAVRFCVVLAVTLIFTALFSVISLAESDAVSRNACGIVNRPLSVDPTGRSEGFSAVLYDNSNGLPTSEANAIAETGEGFLWIGSYAGLIRYDGNTFERMDSTGGLTSIKCLYVDSKDRLWIGTNDNGVAMLAKGQLRRWGKLDGMTSAHTRAITEDQNGTIYIATSRGIAMIDADGNFRMMEDSVLAEADMRDLRIGNDGVIYGTTDSGDLLTIRDGKLLSFITLADSPLGGVGAILPDPEAPGRIYHEAADLGLYYVDLNGGFTVLEKFDIAPLTYLRQMEYIDGKIWICAGNGIGVLEDGHFTLLENLPMNSNVVRVMTDYLGNLWFASTRQGVMKVVPNQFSDLFGRFGLPAKVANSTCMCGDQLLIGTDTGLIVLDENGPVSSMPLTKAVTASGKDLEADDLIKLLSGVRIRSILRDSKDRIWISTWRACGLLRYDHGEVTAFTIEDGMLSANLRSVSEREDGTILVALTGGVNVIDGDRVAASYGKQDGIVITESMTVTEGWNGDIVLGSNGGGIYVINASGGLRCVDVEDGLPSDTVLRLKRDTKRNVIWIVSSSAIAYMTPDYKVTAVKKFPYPNNFDLYEAGNGDMWVLSSNGIYVVSADELIANGEINPVFYGVASGLPCIATANSYSELTADGDLYIAGSTGVCKVNVDKPFEDVNDLKAVVPYVEADGKIIYPNQSGEFTVPSDTQKLTVMGSVYNYSLSDPKVTYQLEGFDHQRTTVSRSEMLPSDYTNLNGGTYHYVMQLKDSLGRGNKEVSVTIVKEKAFYEETWFFVVAGLVLLNLIVAVVRLYVGKKTRAFEKKQQESREQFEQTAEALASAIDAKDKYTNGHSRRVAEYSLKIAQEVGKTEEECEKIYFAALLHDVGKIGVPIEILSKKGMLTDEEFEYIKQHPGMGGQILSSIKKSPWLSIGARYHHERYNGKGYPEGLKGESIPEIARIIAVADAYDAMTSNRSYRNAIPQHIVREEIVKGIGAQFDPQFAKVMLHLIDLDSEYRMQEMASGTKRAPVTSLRCESIYHDCTEGIIVSKQPTRISLCSQPDDGVPEDESRPTLLVFDSLDGKVHPGEESNKDLLYFEYARLRLDGQVRECNVRKSEVRLPSQDTALGHPDFGEPERGQRYTVEAVRNTDHVLLRVSDEERVYEVILALPDTSRFVYLAITGEHCEVHNIRVETDAKEADPASIPRIAEEISYIRDCPQGDVPNIQVDSWRTAATAGIPVRDGMTLTFHTMSLPTARLVWHCPFISVFSSADGQVNGEDFREYMLLRLDGESWESDEYVQNKVQVEQLESFVGWNVWKEKNKQGLDCRVTIRRDKHRITMQTENLGIAISSVTEIHDNVKDVFIAITGDQCAVTNIHVSRNE